MATTTHTMSLIEIVEDATGDAVRSWEEAPHRADRVAAAMLGQINRDEFFIRVTPPEHRPIEEVQ